MRVLTVFIFLALISRLQVVLYSLDVLKMEQIKTQLTLAVLKSDEWTDEDVQFQKNQEVTYSKGTTRNPDEYILTATYLFKDDIKADLTLSSLKQIAGVTGKVSLHRCPQEGRSIGDWLGCMSDPRANYREIKW